MAAIPTPEAGLVIAYAYLCHTEHQAGQEEARKDRPSVTVLPITHAAPTQAGDAVEIPPAIKRHLGLDEQRSWVVVVEGNEFVWPGYDLRKNPRTDRYDYGFLPPRFFMQVLNAFLAAHPSGATLTPRD